jgi:hypothetical protein
MSEVKNREQNQKQNQNQKAQVSERDQAISENWAEETIADLDEFIESQGIYIRQ